MYGMFGSCSSLTSLNLSSFNTANVTNMQSVFSGCSSLTSLNLSSFNTANVFNMYRMFNNCTSLKNLDMSNFNTSSINLSSSMFDNVPAQCFVYMPTGVIDYIKNQRSKNLVLKSGSTWTCANCEMTLDTEYDIWYPFTATALTVPGSDASSHVVYVSNAYHSAVRNTNAAIPAGLVKLTLPKTQAVWTRGNGTLTFLYSATPYKAGDTYNGETVTKVWYGYDITESGTGTPAWISTVKSSATVVKFDTSFSNVHPTSCAHWFEGCTELQYLDLQTFNTDKVTTAADMFKSVPEQALVYMSSSATSTFTAQRPKNLVLNYGANDLRCSKCVFIDGKTMTVPYGFKALGGVTYEKSIPGGTGSGKTVFLPYDCPVPEGVTAYTLRTDKQDLLAEAKVRFEPVETGVMKAYNPYLIVNSGADLAGLGTTKDTQVLPTTTAPAEKVYGDQHFTGTARSFSHSEAVAMNAYTLQDGNVWQRVATMASGVISAGRAYLTTPSGAAKLTAVFPQLGDANDDGRVDIADVTAILRSIGGTTPATFNTKLADANQDGTIGMADVNAIISIISRTY